MNSEFRSPLLVLSFAILAWAGMNFAGTLIERRGKEAQARQGVERVNRSKLEEVAAVKLREPKRTAVLVKPTVETPVAITGADTTRNPSANFSPVAKNFSNPSSPKAGTAEAPVP